MKKTCKFLAALTFAMLAMPGAAQSLEVSGQDTLTASVQEQMFRGYIKSPLYGGQGGTYFSDDLTSVRRLVGVVVRHGQLVDSITGTYEMTDGSIVAGEKHGGNGGTESSFTLARGEYINRMDVRSGQFVDQVTFYTNKGNVYGPYGGDGGTLSVIQSSRAIMGFYGRSGDLVDAIGVYKAR